MDQVTTTTVRLVGVTGHLEPVHAEQVTDRRAGIIVLGPDGRSMPETRDWLYAGINSHWKVTSAPVRVSLPPSHEPPPGSATDLAFAAAILTLNGVFRATALDGVVLIGELGLDGSIRPVRGVLPMVAAAARADLGTVVVPAANAHEAGLVPGVQVIAVDSLRQFVLWASFGITLDWMFDPWRCIHDYDSPTGGPSAEWLTGPGIDPDLLVTVTLVAVEIRWAQMWQTYWFADMGGAVNLAIDSIPETSPPGISVACHRRWCDVCPGDTKPGPGDTARAPCRCSCHDTGTPS